MALPFLLPFAITAAAKGLTGILQASRANRLKPDNYIPPSLQQNIREAESLAGKSRYIGQEYDESNVRRNSANALSAAKEATNSSANLLNAASAIQSKENDAMNSIGNKALQFQQLNRTNAQNLRGQRANIEMDNMRRYWATKSSMKGAAIQNIFGGLTTLGQGMIGQQMLAPQSGGGNLLNSAQGYSQQNNPLTMSHYYNPNNYNNMFFGKVMDS